MGGWRVILRCFPPWLIYVRGKDQPKTTMKEQVNKAPDFSTVHIWQDAEEQCLRGQLYNSESLFHFLLAWALISIYSSIDDI